MTTAPHRPNIAPTLLLAGLLAGFTDPATAGTLGNEWYEYARLNKSGQEQGAWFGGAVAMSGQWAVIGARGDNDAAGSDVGTLEFWQRVPANGSWARRDIVLPPGATDTDLFGESVDIDGGFAVATAKGLDWLGDEFAGAAIVLQQNGLQWDLDGQLVDPDGPGAFLGYGDDVAISGDTVVVGYASAPAGGVQRGKVDVFVRGASTWGPLQTIYGTVDGVRIPDDLDIDGDTLVIGANRANGFVGEVYVHERSGGTFAPTQTLSPQSPTVGAFGIELALDGDRMAILAVDYIEAWARVGGTWQHVQSIHVPGMELGAGLYGEHVALSGDRIHVIREDTGEVLSFLFDGNQYQPEPDILTPTVADSIASFNGDRLMVGHSQENAGRGAVDMLEYVPSTASMIVVAPSPAPAGSLLTIDVSVSADAGTPNGRVQVELTGGGGFLCTNLNLVGGAATCTASLGTPGDYGIVARYQPAFGFAGSDSAPFMHTALPAPTTTTITADTPDPSPGGTPVVVSYTVNGPAEERGQSPTGDPPAGPTGNVTVSDGVDSCTGTVADGQCTIVLGTPGNRSLVASYEGDALFAASQSEPEPHTVVVAANLALDKRQCSDLTRPNAAHRFLLEVTNAGPSDAENVELVDELPPDMTFLAASPGCSEAAGIVTCALGTLTADQTVNAVIEVQLTADPAPAMINTASVTSTTDDPSLANNSDMTVTVRLDALIVADGFEFCGDAP